MTAPHKQWPKAGCVTASPWRELPVWFNVEGHSLLGLLTLPAPGIAPQCALVIAVEIGRAHV